MDLLLFLLQIPAFLFYFSWDHCCPGSPPHTRCPFTLYKALVLCPFSSGLIKKWTCFSPSLLCDVKRAFPLFGVLSIECWYAEFLQLCSPAASSCHYPELSVKLIGSHLFFSSNMQRQVLTLLVLELKQTEIFLQLLISTPLAVCLLFVLSMPNLVLSTSFHPPHPPNLTVPTLLSPSPSCTLHHPTFSPPTRLIRTPAPLQLSTKTPQQMCSRTAVQDKLHPALPCPSWGRGWGWREGTCCMLGVSFSDKLRFGRPEMRGKGSQGQILLCVWRGRTKCWTLNSCCWAHYI